jgi:hypothetical protein
MKLDAGVGTATDVMVSALNGTIQAPGMYAFHHWTAIPVASTAALMGLLTILEMAEP